MSINIKIALLFCCLMLNTFVLYSQRCPDCGCNKRVHRNLKLLKKQKEAFFYQPVKVDGIYLINQIVKLADSSYTTYYYYIRFFNNGRIYFSCPYLSPPDSIGANDLNYGDYGYFKVTGNEIKAETFRPSPGYYYIYFEIKSNSIIQIATQSRSFIFPSKRENTRSYTFEYNFVPLPVNSEAFW